MAILYGQPGYDYYANGYLAPSDQGFNPNFNPDRAAIAAQAAPAGRGIVNAAVPAAPPPPVSAPIPPATPTPAVPNTDSNWEGTGGTYAQYWAGIAARAGGAPMPAFSTPAPAASGPPPGAQVVVDGPGFMPPPASPFVANRGIVDPATTTATLAPAPAPPPAPAPAAPPAIQQPANAPTAADLAARSAPGFNALQPAPTPPVSSGPPPGTPVVSDPAWPAAPPTVAAPAAAPVTPVAPSAVTPATPPGTPPPNGNTAPAPNVFSPGVRTAGKAYQGQQLQTQTPLAPTIDQLPNTAGQTGPVSTSTGIVNKSLGST